MVVLAASVLTKSGKPLVSRQFMDMSRIRIEGLLAAFPKLVGSGGKQHTYLETDAVRYVFQPMEGLYLVLITNKQSNILEDLETLRLLSKLVPEFSGALEEEAICDHAFDLIFAFDEVISLGHKETTTVMQVKQNCEMESHEEKLHKMIMQTKIQETKEAMKKRAQEIEKQRMEQSKKMGGGGSGMMGSAMAAFGKSAGFGADSSIGGGGMGPDLSSSRLEPPPARSTAPLGKGPGKGMQLGKAKKTNAFLENLAKEGEVVELEVPSTSAGGARGGTGGAVATVTANLSGDPVTLNVEEKLSVQLNKQGGLENLEVQGTLSLLVHAEPEAFLSITVTSPGSKAFQFKTHPNIDKATYSSKGVLVLKDPSRPFPTGSELGILKWRMQSKDEALVPITINCWPSVSGGQSFVNIEYESTASFDLQHVTITIPLPSGPPNISQCDGEWRYDARNSALVWTIDLVDDSNRSGSMEFAVGACDGDSFYPIDVAFTSDRTFCDLSIDSVVNTQRDGPAKYGSRRVLSTAEYIVA